MSHRAILLAVLVVLFLAGIGGCVIGVGSFWLKLMTNHPGGMRSIYNVTDFDNRLVGYAEGIAPVIDQLRAYIDREGTCPQDSEQLKSILPDSKFPEDMSYIDGWRYTYHDDRSFSLAAKLGWDPVLIYCFDGRDEYWIYDPGDGSQETTIQLLQQYR